METKNLKVLRISSPDDTLDIIGRLISLVDNAAIMAATFAVLAEKGECEAILEGADLFVKNIMIVMNDINKDYAYDLSPEDQEKIEKASAPKPSPKPTTKGNSTLH